MEIENRVQGSYSSHVLALPYPAQGHINPMLQFSKRLVSKGVKVTLATSVYLSKTMHADTQGSIQIATISDGFDQGGFAEAESTDVYLQVFTQVGSRTLAELVKKLQDAGHPVQALVYDAFLPWALDVAKQFGTLGVAFFTQSCAVNNVYYHVHKGALKPPLSVPSVSLPGMPKLELSETPSFLSHHGSYPGFYHMVVNQFSNIDKADLLLFNIFYDLEKEGVDWMSKQWKVRTIGPTVPSKFLDKRLEDDENYGINIYEPKTAVCMNWLNQRQSGSVVYVSFGSWSGVTEEQMEEIACGLRGSNHYFLWVVRESEEGKLPKNFKQETCDKGLIVNWCPQLDVLAHKAVGCFVTHCGFNSVLESLSIGVPLVAMPLWTDQPTNAKFVEDVWGTGVRVGQDGNGIARRDVMERAIKEVMEGEKAKEIKKNATKWRDLAIQAVDEGGSSDKNIEEFVAILASS